MKRTNLGAIPADLATALSRIQAALGDAEADAFVYVATVCEVSLRVMAEARPSAVRDHARTAEIALRMPDGPAGVVLGQLKDVRVEIREGA